MFRSAGSRRRGNSEPAAAELFSRTLQPPVFSGLGAVGIMLDTGGPTRPHFLALCERFGIVAVGPVETYSHLCRVLFASAGATKADLLHILQETEAATLTNTLPTSDDTGAELAGIRAAIEEVRGLPDDLAKSSHQQK